VQKVLARISFSFDLSQQRNRNLIPVFLIDVLRQNCQIYQQPFRPSQRTYIACSVVSSSHYPIRRFVKGPSSLVFQLTITQQLMQQEIADCRIWSLILTHTPLASRHEPLEPNRRFRLPRKSLILASLMYQTACGRHDSEPALSNPKPFVLPPHNRNGQSKALALACSMAPTTQPSVTKPSRN
jgi:hypothetical protein